MTQGQYIDAKEVLEAVQRLPVEAQRAVVNMVRGAVVVNDVYTASIYPPSRGPEGGPTPVSRPAP